jgi:hypothetical protein
MAILSYITAACPRMNFAWVPASFSGSQHCDPARLDANCQ